MSILEIRPRKGENKRFFGAREAAKREGYPDVYTYLRATGQVNEWHEEVPESETTMVLKAENARRLTQLLGLKYNEFRRT